MPLNFGDQKRAGMAVSAPEPRTNTAAHGRPIGARTAARPTEASGARAARGRHHAALERRAAVRSVSHRPPEDFTDRPASRPSDRLADRSDLPKVWPGARQTDPRPPDPRLAHTNRLTLLHNNTFAH